MKVKITLIEKIPRKNLYKVYEDDEVLAILNDFSIVNLGIKVGKEFDLYDFNQMIFEAKKGEAFETLLNILGQTALTTFVARNKLRQKGFDNDEIIEYAINKAETYGYINDKEYATSYIKYTTEKSKRRIQADLASKGISSKLYSEELDEYDEYEACKKHMSKLIKGEFDEEKKRKLFARVYMQGYPFDIIKSVFEELTEEDLF